MFLPLSETCIDADGSSSSEWPGKESTQVVELPIVDSINTQPSLLAAGNLAEQNF